MDNALDKEVKVEETEVPYTQVLGESIAEQQTVTERIEEALGKLLMKFKELEDRIDDLENTVADLKGDYDDYDWDDFDRRLDDIDTRFQETLETLRSV